MGALLGGARADDLVVGGVVAQDADQLGDALVLVGHVGVGPHDDLAAGLLGADPAGRAGAAVAAERQDPQVGVVELRVAEHVEGVVGAGVVDAEHLVGELAGLHRRGDAVDLLEHVGALVEAGQHDRDVGGRAGAGGAVLDRVRRVAGPGARSGGRGGRGGRRDGIRGGGREAGGGGRVVAAAGLLTGAHRDLLGGGGVEVVVVLLVLVHRPRAYRRGLRLPAAALGGCLADAASREWPSHGENEAHGRPAGGRGGAHGRLHGGSDGDRSQGTGVVGSPVRHGVTLRAAAPHGSARGVRRRPCSAGGPGRRGRGGRFELLPRAEAGPGRRCSGTGVARLPTRVVRSSR